MRHPAIAALILAGGRSARMGTAKDTVRLADGRPMLQHVLDAVRPLGLDIHLSTAAEPTPAQRASGLPLLPDAAAHQGPLAAVAHALASLPVAGLLVLCCDQPLLRPADLAVLIPATAADPRPAFHLAPAHGGIIPFPGYYPAAALVAMRAHLAAGGRSPRRWAATVDCRPVATSTATLAALASFNTRAELAAARLITPEVPA